MMTILAVTLLVLVGSVFALMASLPLVLEVDAPAGRPENIVALDPVSRFSQDANHRPAA